MSLEIVLLALHPDLADARPVDGGLDSAQAAEQLRQIAARIESRTAADPAAASRDLGSTP
jgi:uncharacterized protein (DUF1501 family)